MIRTKCPHCGKLLGINDGAAGTVAQCPMCEKKFRVPTPRAGGPAGTKPSAAGPARPPVRQAADEFPEVEVDEEATATRSRAPARAGKRPAQREEDEEVAELDSDEADEDREEERPRRREGVGKKKKKRGRDQERDAMILRNRIVGSIGALAGVALAVIGAARWLPDSVIDPEKSHFGATAAYMWLVPTIFGALMIMVGVFYVFKTE